MYNKAERATYTLHTKSKGQNTKQIKETTSAGITCQVNMAYFLALLKPWRAKCKR